MNLTINPSSGIPIYKQIYDQLERMIINKSLAANSFVPSVRQLALELEVNPMTISKAYSLLEERGFLLRLRGKGMAVAVINNVQNHEEKLHIVNKNIQDLIIEAAQMGISLNELQQLIENKLIDDSNVVLFAKGDI
ncbi:GntR family transcriptional regulator [Colwellia sp. RE-S-Sl-9]